MNRKVIHEEQIFVSLLSRLDELEKFVQDLKEDTVKVIEIYHTNESTNRKNREYHRKWRESHPESVRAAQVKYWNKKAQEAK